RARRPRARAGVVVLGCRDPPELPSFPTRRSSDLHSYLGALLALILFYISFEFTIVSSIPLMTEVLPHARATVMASFFILASIGRDRKSTRLNSSHVKISYAVFCLKK